MKKRKKLSLRRETLHALNPSALSNVAGGVSENPSDCETGCCVTQISCTCYVSCGAVCFTVAADTCYGACTS